MNGELPELIACPFCGSTELKALTHAVVCLGCDATGPMPKTTLSARPSMAQVVLAWNERTGATTQAVSASFAIRNFGIAARKVLDLIEATESGRVDGA